MEENLDAVNAQTTRVPSRLHIYVDKKSPCPHNKEDPWVEEKFNTLRYCPTDPTDFQVQSRHLSYLNLPWKFCVLCKVLQSLCKGTDTLSAMGRF